MPLTSGAQHLISRGKRTAGLALGGIEFVASAVVARFISAQRALSMIIPLSG